MELCANGNLFDLIVEKEQLEEKEARNIFRQLASGVGYFHDQGICHRDLKVCLEACSIWCSVSNLQSIVCQCVQPENILFDGKNNLKISDFGLCHFGIGRPFACILANCNDLMEFEVRRFQKLTVP